MLAGLLSSWEGGEARSTCQWPDHRCGTASCPQEVKFSPKMTIRGGIKSATIQSKGSPLPFLVFGFVSSICEDWHIPVLVLQASLVYHYLSIIGLFSFSNMSSYDTDRWVLKYFLCLRLITVTKLSRLTTLNRKYAFQLTTSEVSVH